MPTPTPFASVLHPIEETFKAAGSKSNKQTISIKEEARRHGYEEGLASGKSEGLELGLVEGRSLGRSEAFRIVHADEQAKLDQFSQELDQFALDLKVSADLWFAQAEANLTDLVTHLATKVLAQELQMSRESILAIVKQAIAETGLKGAIRLRLSPQDRPLLEQHQDDLKSTFAKITSIDLVDDNSIASGCIIETSSGVLDATTSRKLEEFQTHLKDQAA